MHNNLTGFDKLRSSTSLKRAVALGAMTLGWSIMPILKSPDAPRTGAECLMQNTEIDAQVQTRFTQSKAAVKRAAMQPFVPDRFIPYTKPTIVNSRPGEITSVISKVDNGNTIFRISAFTPDAMTGNDCGSKLQISIDKKGKSNEYDQSIYFLDITKRDREGWDFFTSKDNISEALYTTNTDQENANAALATIEQVNQIFREADTVIAATTS